MQLPSLDLPPADGAADSTSSATCGAGAEQDAGALAAAAATPQSEAMGAAPEGCAAANHADMQHLLAEMGDLVCKLQQKQEMTITAQEVSPDELLERLLHFREVADTTALQ